LKKIKNNYQKIQNKINNYSRTFKNTNNKNNNKTQKKNQAKINDTMLNFEIRLDIHKKFINTLISLSSDKEKNAELFPLLVIFFNNINDDNLRKEFVKYFIRNMGNINLSSSKKNITALSTAINLQDAELVIFLVENGASVKLLNPKDYDDYNKLIEEDEKTFHLTNEPPIAKLMIPMELPNELGYNPDIEPEFWKQIFKDNEMITIRNKIHEMMNADASIPIENDNYKSNRIKTFDLEALEKERNAEITQMPVPDPFSSVGGSGGGFSMPSCRGGPDAGMSM
jgi:hypothetical protein